MEVERAERVRTSAVCKQAAGAARTHTRARMGIRPVKIYARDKLQIVPLKEFATCMTYMSLKYILKIHIKKQLKLGL